MTVPGDKDEIMNIDKLLAYSRDCHRPWVPESPLIQ